MCCRRRRIAGSRGFPPARASSTRPGERGRRARAAVHGTRISVPDRRSHHFDDLAGSWPRSAPHVARPAARLVINHRRRYWASRPSPTARCSPGAAPSTVFVHRASGFSDCERSAEGSWRWMADRGEWQIDNLAPEPRTVAVAIELQAFPGERAIAIDVNGHPIQEVLVQPAREWHRIGPLVLQAGANRLQFRPLTSPTVAADVLHNGDPRRLSLAVWTWKWLGPPVRSVKE